MVTIEKLSKHYKNNVKALTDLSLTLPAQGMFGLLGVNGAGKTTLMRILAGLLKPTSGRVTVCGHDLADTRGKQMAQSVLGYLPQELGAYPSLNAREFLDYIAILKGLTDRAARTAQIERLLELVNLSAKATAPIKTYSGGMKRRVGIAQALLGQPRLVIVDEPTAGLDPEERIRLRNLLSDVARDCLVLLSTHIVEDISQSCNDLAVLYNGRLLFRGAPRTLIADARPHVWSLNTTGARPSGALTVIASLQMETHVQYRVLGTPAPHEQAERVEPTLEDGYMWLMTQARDAL